MANYLQPAHFGSSHLPRLHVGHLHLEEVVHPVVVARTPSCHHAAVGLAYHEALQTAQQTRQFELGLRGTTG